MMHGACRSVNNWSKLDKVGEGTYGSVYKAADRATGALVALKRIKLSSNEREGMPLTSLREVSLLRRLRHPNIVKLLEVAVGSKLGSLFLAFEFCEYDLSRLLDSMPSPFTPSETKCLLEQLLSAMAFMHTNLVIHRDIKLSNLLLTSNGTLKLCDFGLARRIDGNAAAEGSYTSKVVTLWYRAPELLFGATRYGAQIDMWAFGCIMGELLLHRPLLPGSTELKQVQLIAELLGTPSEKIWPAFPSLPLATKMKLPEQPYNELPHRFARVKPAPDALELLENLLRYDPLTRISASEALRHRYFSAPPFAARRERISERLPPVPRGSATPSSHKRPREAHDAGSARNHPANSSDGPRRSACAQQLRDEESGGSGSGPRQGGSGGGAHLGTPAAAAERFRMRKAQQATQSAGASSGEGGSQLAASHQGASHLFGGREGGVSDSGATIDRTNACISSSSSGTAHVMAAVARLPSPASVLASSDRQL